MENQKVILLVINTDSQDDKNLLEKVALYSSLYDMQINLLYVIPDINPYYYQVPPIVGATNMKPLLPHAEKERNKAVHIIKKLATKLEIHQDRCFLVSGAHNTEVKRFIRLLKPEVVIGYKAPIFELFKSTKLYRILYKHMRYVWTLIAGYKFHLKKPSGGVPLFVK